MKKAIHYIFVLSYFVFFTQVTTAQPVISDLSLDASTTAHSTNDNLTTTFTDGPGVVESAIAWYRNGSPEGLLHLPFEASASEALLDFSGSNNHAYIDTDPATVPTWVSAGGNNGSGAFTFDGGDYLHAGDIFPLNSSYTKTAWINVSGVGMRHIMSSILNNLNNHFFKVGDDGSLAAGHRFGIPSVHDGTPLTPGQWYFVAVTFDYVSGEMILYKDGDRVDRAYVSAEYRSIVDPSVLVGSFQQLYGFVGSIDEARVYDHALTPEQINSMYVNGSNVILANETRGADEWFVNVTPFSVSEVGSAYTSNTLTLQGPVVSNASLTSATPLNLSIDDLTNTFSANGAVIETASTWSRNGAPWSLLYLPFEAMSSNALLDFSGSNNHPVTPDDIDDKPTWYASAGHDGSGAFIFDATDYLYAGDILPLNSSYTKTAWIMTRLTGDGWNRHIMSSVLNDAGNHFFKVTSDGHLAAGHRWAIPSVQDGTPLNPDVWHFVAVTFDYSTGQIILYKDGNVVDTGTVPEEYRSVVDPAVLVGSFEYLYGFYGTIDEPALYGHALSPEQINSMYNNGNDIIVAEEILGADEWQVDVTPFSRSDVGSQIASNSVTIHSVFVSDIADQTILEGSSFSSINLEDYVTTYDYVADSLIWSSSGSSELIVDIDPVTNIATIAIPGVNWYGSEDITFTATNPNLDSGSATVTFTVQNDNDAPVLSEIGDQTTDEDQPLIGIPVNFTDVDPSDTHTITVSSDESNVIVETLNGDIDGSTYDLVPADNWFGTAQITVTVTDNGTGTLTDTENYNLTVSSINDNPVLAEIGNQNVDEGNSLTNLTVVYTDLDVADTHTITVSSDEINVTVENLIGDISGSTYDLVPAGNWFGTAHITVTVTDNGTGTLSDTEVYDFIVNGINDAPVLTDIEGQITDEDITLSGLTVEFTDSDPSDTHTITVVSSDPRVTVENLIGNTSGSTYDLVPEENWFGTTQITVTVTDNGSGELSDFEEYTLLINAVNDAPVITDIGDQSIPEDSDLIGLSVIFEDVDDSDLHTITVVSDDSNVTVENLSGNISGSVYDLVPADDWTGSAQITVLVTDNGSGALSDTEIYTFTVTGVNDAPVAILLSNTSVNEKVLPSTGVGQFSTTDVDLADVHTYTFITDGGIFDMDNNAFLIDGDTLRSNVDLDFEVQNTYSILVQSDDGQGGTISQNFTITVNDIDETSVEDIYNNPVFQVYPNPAIDFVTVEIDNPENKKLHLEFYSSTGTLVHAEPIFSKSKIDLTGFSDGMYIVRIQGESVYGTRKIIVKDR